MAAGDGGRLMNPRSEGCAVAQRDRHMNPRRSSGGDKARPRGLGIRGWQRANAPFQPSRACERSMGCGSGATRHPVALSLPITECRVQYSLADRG